METKNDTYIPGATPFMSVPPGATLKEELLERGIKQNAFAQAINMSPSHLSELIKGKIRLTPRIAYKLEETLNIDAVFWLNAQAQYEHDVRTLARQNQIAAQPRPKEPLRLIVEHKTYSFRGEEYPYVHSTYENSTTGERITTSELHEMNMSQVYNLYRAAHGMPMNGRRPTTSEKSHRQTTQTKET